MRRALGLLVVVPALAVAATVTPLLHQQPAQAAAPVHWDACLAIHWRFSPAYAPAGGFAVVARDVRTISRASGISWVYDGTTRATPTSSYLPTDMSRKDVLIGWTDASQSSLLAEATGAVLGDTETNWKDGRYTSAVVALNRRSKLPLTGGGSWETTVLHELGHVMGLKHSTSRRSLMYPLQSKLTSLQPIDLANLRRLGHASGC